MRKGLRFLIGLVILLLVVTGVLVVRRGKVNFAFKQDKPKESDLFEKVVRGDLRITVSGTGVVHPKTVVKIKSRSSGKVERFTVKEGDYVKKGDLIAQIDRSDQLLNVERARIDERLAEASYQKLIKGGDVSQKTRANADLEIAEVEYDRAKNHFDRIKGLEEKGYVTQSEYDQAEAALQNAKIALESAKRNYDTLLGSTSPEDIRIAKLQWDRAKVELKNAKRLLGDSRVVAPIDGRILEKFVDVGDSVVSSLGSFSEGTTLASLADMRNAEVKTTVDEAEIGKVKIGTQAELVFDAFPDEKFKGKVTNIFPMGQSQTGVTTFTVVVGVDNSAGRLLASMTANVGMVVQVKKEIILIPFKAVRIDKENNWAVFVKDKEGKGKARKIDLGDTDYENYEVKSGLKEGEEVMVKNIPNVVEYEKAEKTKDKEKKSNKDEGKKNEVKVKVKVD